MDLFFNTRRGIAHLVVPRLSGNWEPIQGVFGVRQNGTDVPRGMEGRKSLSYLVMMNIYMMYYIYMSINRELAHILLYLMCISTFRSNTS